MEPLTYLERIDYLGKLNPEIKTLATLQRAHLHAVPFENLDIHLGRAISLDLPALYDKIVLRRRGGFCYELNGLFAWLLQALGFRVTYLSASDVRADGTIGPEFDHLTLLVELPTEDHASRGQPVDRRLVDVGWGDTFHQPLCIDGPDLQEQGSRAYRLERQDGGYLLWQRDYDGQWEKQYIFTLRPRKFTEFEAMCRYHQTSPQSLFTQYRMCTRPTPEGRITLYDDRLIHTRNGQREEQEVGSEEEFHRILRREFGVKLD